MQHGVTLPEIHPGRVSHLSASMFSVHFKLHDFGAAALQLGRTQGGRGGGAVMLRFASSGFVTGLVPHRTHGKLRFNASASAVDQAFAYYELSGHAATPIVAELRRRCCLPCARGAGGQS